jgi:hypothetical protein
MPGHGRSSSQARLRRAPSVTRCGEVELRAAPPPLAEDLSGASDPNIVSVADTNRLAGGELYAATRRMPWRELLNRTFHVDVERCASCGGRLKVLGAALDPHAARAILERLVLPATAPRVARARDPTELVRQSGRRTSCGEGVLARRVAAGAWCVCKGSRWTAALRPE